MDSVKKPSYKYCVVPLCKNNTVKAPDKHFFSVPENPVVRKKWCKVMKRTRLSQNSRFHCCEDHFNLEEDTENYMEYKIMHNIEGRKMFLRLKKGVFPRYFEVQNRCKPPDRIINVVNRRKMETSKETLVYSNPSSSTASNVTVNTPIHTSHYIMFVPAMDVSIDELESGCMKMEPAVLMDITPGTSTEVEVTTNEPYFSDIKVETQSSDIKLEPEFGDMTLKHESIDIKMEPVDELMDNTLSTLTASTEAVNRLHSVFITEVPEVELTDNDNVELNDYLHNNKEEPVDESNHPQKLDKAVQVNIRAKYRSKGINTKIKDIRRSLLIPKTVTKCIHCSF